MVARRQKIFYDEGYSIGLAGLAVERAGHTQLVITDEAFNELLPVAAIRGSSKR